MQTKQTDLARLLVGTKVFYIPQFQRHYKWKMPQWRELWEDVLDQYDSPDVRSGTLTNDEGHFLGSVVLHPAPGPASTVAKYWVIDGQQRLTTLMALIAALRDFRVRKVEGWIGEAYTNQYLANQYNPESPHRLVLGQNDHSDFQATVYEQSPTGQVGQAYTWFTKELERLEQTGNLDFERLHNAILLRLILVEINTSQDDNINQIFNTINHSGLKLSAIDLIRNHSFMQMDSSRAEQVHREHWVPMEDALGERGLTQYFWAQMVRENPKTTQKDLYGPFQKHLVELSKLNKTKPTVTTERELGRLAAEVNLYLQIIEPADPSESQLPDRLARALKDLDEWGSQTYIPIALEVLSQFSAEKSTAEDAASSLEAVLSLLVRRALSGIPTNNLNRILSSVPSGLRGADSLKSRTINLLQGGGKYWPSDKDVLERARSTPIYVTLSSQQIRYIFGVLNDQRSRNEPVSRASLSVEHILPQELNSAWQDMLRQNDVDLEVAESRTHVLGNLTTTGSNSVLGQRPPNEKFEILAQSNIPLNRGFERVESWLPSDIDLRSDDLAKLCIVAWPRPEFGVVPDIGKGEPVQDAFTPDLVLDSLPADRFASIDVLRDLLAITEEEILDAAMARAYPVFEMGGNRFVGGISTMTQADLQGADPIGIDEILANVQSIGNDA